MQTLRIKSAKISPKVFGASPVLHQTSNTHACDIINNVFKISLVALGAPYSTMGRRAEFCVHMLEEGVVGRVLCTCAFN